MVRLKKINSHNDFDPEKEEEKEERFLDRSGFREAMNRFFDESLWYPWTFRHSPMLPGFVGRHFSYPRIDLTENNKEIKIAADVPGVDPDKLDVTVEDDRVVLKGVMEEEKENKDKGKNYYRYERQYGSFLRQIPLPVRIKVDGAVAEYANGVLRLTLPKSEPRKNRKIKVEKKPEI